MSEPPLRKHRFVPSGRRSYGHRICGRDDCGSLEHHSIHDVPDISEDVKEVEQRKVGERESTQDTETLRDKGSNTWRV